MGRRTVDPVAAGLLIGYAADRLIGDPRRYHPVAGFGSLAAGLERRLWAPSRARGAAYELALVGGTTLGAATAQALARGPVARTLLTAVTTWAVLGGRSLEREAMAVHDHAAAGDLAAARERVRSLVGRDPSTLDADGLGRACVESLAENSSDAVVAPLFWGAVAGVPGLSGYRAVNTLDAMVGHRTPRHEQFGWAAARLDDIVNWLPARLTTALIVAQSPSRAGAILRVVRRDAPQHPSPNAGPIESACAAYLGVSLGGRNTYAGVTEDRGVLGDGPPAQIRDVPRAAALVRDVGGWALAATLAGRVLLRHKTTGARHP
ncbi:MAG: adenosylcobinamide-phosphate synthase CbiB [Micrococcales bacterium]|nr:adenosylcobinamide-phosphate synthase CbiB [Micrococcales bacterium]